MVPHCRLRRRRLRQGHLIKVDHKDEEIQTAMDQHTPKFEELFVAGLLKETKRVKLKPWPQKWDIDLDGDWETQAGAWLRSDLDRDECENKEAIAKPTAERRNEFYRKIKDGEIREFLEEKALQQLKTKSFKRNPKGVKQKRQVDEEDSTLKKTINLFFVLLLSKGVKAQSYAKVSDEECFKKFAGCNESEQIDQMGQEEKEPLTRYSLHYWPCFRIDGSVNFNDRQSQIEAFNPDPECRIFLLSTRAGGLGINLQPQTPSSYPPATGVTSRSPSTRLRAFIGQTKPVTIHRLATKGTMDEYLLDKAYGKSHLEKLVIQSDKFRFLPRSKLLRQRNQTKTAAADNGHAIDII
ncbi:hypothetical protein MMC31_006795 [Peltigera leucophlebia]|nr:hypothetical protein [Peltigera leucophlebia]